MAVWVIPFTRGGPLFLGLGVGALWLLAMDLVDGQSTTATIDAGAAADMSLVVAVVLFAAVWWLDRRDLPRVAAPIVAVGNAAALVGAGGVGARLGGEGGAVAVTLVGLAVGWIGHQRRRRFTTWHGGALVAGGLVSFVVCVVGIDGRPAEAGAWLIALGILLALGVRLAGAVAAPVGPAPLPAPGLDPLDPPPPPSQD